MLSATATTTKDRLYQQIEECRKDAEEAKKLLNYELAFVLIEQADILESQLGNN